MPLILVATWAFTLTCKPPLEDAGLGLKDTEEGLDADDVDDEDEEDEDEDGTGKKAAVAAVATMVDPVENSALSPGDI